MTLGRNVNIMEGSWNSLAWLGHTKSLEMYGSLHNAQLRYSSVTQVYTQVSTNENPGHKNRDLSYKGCCQVTSGHTKVIGQRVEGTRGVMTRVLLRTLVDIESIL